MVHATDGNLTAHCKKLENAGYLTVEKLFVNRKPVTLYSATSSGRNAVKKYAQQLASFFIEKILSMSVHTSMYKSDKTL
ncbi:MAG: transcriptional regulator [Treponema sp.]